MRKNLKPVVLRWKKTHETIQHTQGLVLRKVDLSFVMSWCDSNIYTWNPMIMTGCQCWKANVIASVSFKHLVQWNVAKTNHRQTAPPPHFNPNCTLLHVLNLIGRIVFHYKQTTPCNWKKHLAKYISGVIDVWYNRVSLYMLHTARYSYIISTFSPLVHRYFYHMSIEKIQASLYLQQKT